MASSYGATRMNQQLNQYLYFKRKPCVLSLFLNMIALRAPYLNLFSRARKKNPSGRPGQVGFPFGQVHVTFSYHLPDGQGPRQAVRQLNFWQRFLEEKISFRFKGNQVFRWSLKKITIYSAVLFIVWRALTALKWLPCTWSKSAPIKFLSRIKIAVLGTKTLCLFLYFSNFLRAFFSFSVQNLTQQRYITKQHF